MNRYFQSVAIIIIGVAVTGIGVQIYMMDDGIVGVSAPLVSLGTATVIGVLIKLINDAEYNSNEVVETVYKRLKQYTKVVRYDQTIEFTFQDAEVNDIPCIRVDCKHKYRLRNTSRFKDLTDYPVEIYTEIGRQGQNESAGFSRIYLNDNAFSDEKLKSKTEYKRYKQYLRFLETIKKNNHIKLEFHTVGFFHLKDRIIWTVQDLSDDLTITVTNSTRYMVKSATAGGKENLPHQNQIVFKMNHDLEEAIDVCPEYEALSEQSKQAVQRQDIYTIHFGSAVLPYQGFEMFWDFR